MTYSLDDFCNDARSILAQRDDHEGRDKVRQKLEKLVTDPAFLAAHLGADQRAGVRQIYEDADLHFCVLAYDMAESRTSPPHDHGESWAVYGQAAEYTVMTMWSAENGKVEPVRTFRLEPGQAGLFDVREIHSIQYAAGSKFVRVTGVDLSKTRRRVFDAATGAAREIESVAAAPAR